MPTSQAVMLKPICRPIHFGSSRTVHAGRALAHCIARLGQNWFYINGIAEFERPCAHAPETAKVLKVSTTSQQILHFSRDEFPLSAVLLFDLTASVNAVLKRLAEGAKTALARFKTADEIAVMVYSGHASLIDGFTTDRARTVEAIEKAAGMQSDEPAHFNEAVYQAALQLRQSAKPANRRVIIWLTDNIPNVPYRKEYPAHTEIEAFRALHEKGVVVAPILLKSRFWAALAPIVRAAEASQAKAFPPGDARKYAELTGGDAVGIRGKHPDERLAQLIDELRARYTIGYRPSDPRPAGTFRKISVELAPSGILRPKEWTVLARERYYR